jgi:DNA-binding beta-propeller fold protein YncE
MAWATTALLTGGVLGPLSAQTVTDPLYICVQDEARIAVVDMASRTVVRTIDLTALGFSANAKPHHIVGEPDGSFWYVSLIGDNRVIKLDRNDRVVAQGTMETPGMLALDPSRDLLIVSRSMSAVDPPRRIGLLRRSDLQGDELDVFFPRPHPVALAPSGLAYTGSLGANQMASVDLDQETVVLTDIEGTSHALVQFAVSPDGRTLVASTELTGLLLVFDLGTPEKPRRVASIPLGHMAFDPIFAPDGSTVWVPVKGTNEVVVVDASTWTVVERIAHDGLKQPHAIAFAADGTTAFVSNNNTADHMADHAAHAGMSQGPGALVVIDVATRRVLDAIEIGRNLTGMGVRVGG